MSRRPRWRAELPPAPFRRERWRSPLRGPWLASLLGTALLPLIVICAATGFLSHAAYMTDLGDNSVTGPGSLGIDPYFFDWPTSPVWVYAATQGLHVVAGVALIPLLLAKLWSAMPKLFEWPPVRSAAHFVERLSLVLLVGGSLFVVFTGVINIQSWYPWGFSFVSAHYYGSFVFLGALGLHLVTKVPVAIRAFREHGVVAPLRDDLAATEPEPPAAGTTAPAAPAAATISRRGLITTVAAGSIGLATMAAAQSIGGPLRPLALLAPRGRTAGEGPNDFPVNKTAVAAGIDRRATGSTWRLRLEGERTVELSREQLLAMQQRSERLPIACVEGWSTTQAWSGVPVRDLAGLAGGEGAEVTVESLQAGGSFRAATLSAHQAADERTLLALAVNGAELSLDHGFPARIIAPGVPGVHCTKWVASMRFGARA